ERGYPLLCTRTDFGKILTTIPLSYYVQATACWWMRMGMIRVYAFLQRLNRGERFLDKVWSGGYHMCLQVHDELVFDFPSGRSKGKDPWEYNLPVVREVQRLMAKCGDDIGVPTPVSAEFHENNWSEGIAL